ncbi:hypothetical protein ES708_00508 [subsurface metagenome]
MRGDDGAGSFFGRILSERTNMTVIDGCDAPENSTGIILKESPDEIVIVDALDFGGKPGESICLTVDHLDGSGISTHGSLGLFIEYLQLSTSARIMIIGFQPKTVNLGDELTPEMINGVKRVVDEIILTGKICDISFA